MKTVSMAEVARHAGVSKNTVSLALRDSSRVSTAVRKRVKAIADELGYVPNAVVAGLMVELRRGKPTGYRRSLALLNCHPDPDVLTTQPTIVAWMKGCRARAAQQGYAIEEIRVHDPSLTPEALDERLDGSAVEGVVLVGAFRPSHLPSGWDDVWRRRAVVVTGFRTHNPTLPFACVDHHELVLEAVKQVRALGYSRPALVVDSANDRLVDGRFSSAMWLAQRGLDPADRVPWFSGRLDDEASQARFSVWYTQHRPDVILALYPKVLDWLLELGVHVPEDVGLVLLERRHDFPDCASMDQHNEVAGEAAIDMVVNMLHSREFGVPSNARATLIGATWHPGTSVCKRPKG